MMRIRFFLLIISFFTLSHAEGEVYYSGKCSLAINSPELDDPLTVNNDTFRVNYLKAFNSVYIELSDLQSCDIEIRRKKIKTTMASRPTFYSMFRKKSKRKYIIVVNSNSEFKGVRLKDVPSEAQIGLFAHELMHVRDYQSQNFSGMVKRGWQYLSKRGKIKLEHHIDSMTIAAGFGKYLYEWSFYVLNNSSASEDYKAFKLETYMTPEAILNSLKE